MPVRLKSVLRAAVDTVFASARAMRIPASEAREQFHDWIDSLLAPADIQASDSTIIIDRSTPGVIRLRADTSGGTPTPISHPTLYFGTSADSTPTGAELTIQGSMGQGTIPAYSGSMHHLIARLATEGDISSVLYSDDASRTNQLMAFTKAAGTVVPAGETEQYAVWVSNQALTQTADVTLTVS